MVLAVYFSVLVCLSGQQCPTKEIVGKNAYYSLTTCESDARLVAQAMFVKSGIKYGFKCVQPDYDPPRMQ